jgi:hypothetical protein
MAYSLSGPVDLWKDINALQTGATQPNAEDEGPPGYRNIELYLGCDWDGAAAPKCQEAQAKAVSPLFYGKNWISGDPGIRDSSCPLVRITRARGANPPEDLAEAKALDDELWSRGCRTDPSVPANVDSQVLVRDLPGSEHGFDQWDVVTSTGETIGDQIIADHDLYMK